MCDFDNPAPGALARLALESIRLLFTPLDVKDTAAIFYDLPDWLAPV